MAKRSTQPRKSPETPEAPEADENTMSKTTTPGTPGSGADEDQTTTEDPRREDERAATGDAVKPEPSMLPVGVSGVVEQMFGPIDPDDEARQKLTILSEATESLAQHIVNNTPRGHARRRALELLRSSQIAAQDAITRHRAIERLG